MSRRRIRKSKKISIKTVKTLLRANFFVVSEVWNNHRKVMLMTVGLSALMSLSGYFQNGAEALLINYLTDHLGVNIVIRDLFWLSMLIPAVVLFSGILSSLREHWDRLGWRDMRTRFDVVFAEKLSSLDVATHEDPKFQDKIQLLDENGSSFMLANFYMSFIRNVFHISGLIISAIIMLQVNWQILLIVSVATLPRFFVELKFGEQLWTIYQSHSESKRHLMHAREQVRRVSGIRELQTYQTTNFFIDRVKKILDDFHIEQSKKDKEALSWKFLTQGVSALSFGFVVWILLQPVILGSMQIGTFVFILSASLGFQQSIIGFFLAISEQYQNAEAVNTFIEVMGESRRISESSNAEKIILSKAPKIEFKNISFAYPSKPNDYVLKDFNLTIESGEKLALVGVNGAGKSTFIKLLCRFYDPTEGQIFINGVDLKDIKLSDWYKYIALLAQDYQTYKLPVKELIHLGKIDFNRTESNVKEASLRADADEFVQKWEGAYDQQIGVEFKGGVDPSHGQKQKLSLARAMFRKAFVTILDEPTASVDAKAEKQIFDQLEKIMGDDRTLILISHRFATVRNADKIAVIDGCNISELGTHEELLKLKGTYNQMYSAQAEGYKD